MSLGLAGIAWFEPIRYELGGMMQVKSIVVPDTKIILKTPAALALSKTIQKPIPPNITEKLEA
mgnify:CR=1 FL=1